MRILVFFDLPVVKENERKVYNQFRRFLLNDGYDMIQYSVYSRLCNGTDMTNKHLKRLNKILPEKGSIRCLTITEKQYENMKFLVGKPTTQKSSILFLKNNMLQSSLLTDYSLTYYIISKLKRKL